MHASGIGPLSHGQLEVWREVEGLPRERWHEANTWSGWSLPDGVETEQVRRALRTVGAHHPSLHTAYDLADPTSPTQSVAAFDDVELTAFESGETAAMAAEVFDRPFDLRHGFGWRAHVVTESGRPTEVLLVRHHIVADGWCDGLLERDFYTFLRDPAAAPAATGPLELATWQHAAQQQRTWASAAAHWEKVLTFGAGNGFPGADPNVNQGLQCTVRSRVAHAHARELAARTRTSLSSVVLAAYTLAVARVTGVERLVAESMCSNRFRPQWREVVTSMNQWSAAPITAVDDLEEHISRVHRAAMTAYRHSMYDVDAVAGLRSSTGSHEATCAYNFFTWQDLSGLPADDPEPVWEEPFSTIGHGCYLRAAEEAGVSLTLRLRTKGIEKDRAAAVMKHMYTSLVPDLS
jgi:Condensation domain